MSVTQRPPGWFRWALLVFSFVAAMLWMDIVAGEAVNVLQSLGYIWKLEMEILTMTVLAWGNSIGDLVKTPADPIRCAPFK